MRIGRVRVFKAVTGYLDETGFACPCTMGFMEITDEMARIPKPKIKIHLIGGSRNGKCIEVNGYESGRMRDHFGVPNYLDHSLMDWYERTGTNSARFTATHPIPKPEPEPPKEP